MVVYRDGGEHHVELSGSPRPAPLQPGPSVFNAGLGTNRRIGEGRRMRIGGSPFI